MLAALTVPPAPLPAAGAGPADSNTRPGFNAVLSPPPSLFAAIVLVALAPLTTLVASRAVLGPTDSTRFAVPVSAGAALPALAGVVGCAGRVGDRTLDASVLVCATRDGGGRRDDDEEPDRADAGRERESVGAASTIGRPRSYVRGGDRVEGRVRGAKVKLDQQGSRDFRGRRSSGIHSFFFFYAPD